MEALLHDDLLGSDDDNPALSSGEFNFDEAHHFTQEDAELAGLGVNHADAVSAHTSHMGLPARKVHSAAPSLSVFNGESIYEDIPRPYTSAGLDSPPPSRKQRKKKSSARVKKSARNNDTPPREDRPRSADVNEWGDFDTDRLLRDESAFLDDRSNQHSLDPLDEQRSKSRRSRRSTPAMTSSSPRPNPWDGYLYLNNESKEASKPVMQVLRQKSIEILNLDLVGQANHSTARTTSTPKPLLGRATLERLMSTRSRPTTSYASRPATPTPLFGTDIADSPKNRATIFGRLAALWALIAHRSSPSPGDQRLNSPDTATTRSPFECSMAMVKLCKTVGIALTPSAATHLSFWYTSEQGVDFESFCDVVVQGAIQPALHHFNLDNSVDEYVAALDTVIQSLMTTEPARRRKNKAAAAECPRRLKELNEIQPVFMGWKGGITPRLVQPSEDLGPTTPTRALITAEKVRKALEASASQHMLAHQLPSEEARVTHVENIRRKVQLHKSWKFISDGKIVDRVSSPSALVSRGGSSSSSQDEWNKFADLSEMLERDRSVLPTSAGAASFIGAEGDHPEVQVEHSTPEAEPAKDANDEVLVCCSCSVRDAVLWCSSCFTVNCQKCWQETHACTVDMSMVSPEQASTKTPLLGPTALALKKKRCGSATLRPPVAMIYLPTKAIVPGTLAKGNSIVRHRRKSSPNQVSASNAVKDEVPVVVANAILPSLHTNRPAGKLQRHHERAQVESTTPTTDSTADLVKSLMLRVSPSTPTTGSHSTGSHTSTESAMRVHKHHASSRPKLPLAPVSLDAGLLLSHEPDRRR